MEEIRIILLVIYIVAAAMGIGILLIARHGKPKSH